MDISHSCPIVDAPLRQPPYSLSAPKNSMHTRLWTQLGQSRKNPRDSDPASRFWTWNRLTPISGGRSRVTLGLVPFRGGVLSTPRGGYPQFFASYPQKGCFGDFPLDFHSPKCGLVRIETRFPAKRPLGGSRKRVSMALQTRRSLQPICRGDLVQQNFHLIQELVQSLHLFRECLTCQPQLSHRRLPVLQLRGW